jgi:catechol 2,3-dioxygenase-like lactoylglutathione lyase family enzyme
VYADVVALGERPGLLGLIGAALVVAGVLLIGSGQTNPKGVGYGLLAASPSPAGSPCILVLYAMWLAPVSSRRGQFGAAAGRGGHRGRRNCRDCRIVMWCGREVAMQVLSSRVLVRPADLEKSTAFYRDVLGLAVYRTFPGGTVFFLGQGFLEVAGHGEAAPASNFAVWLQVRDLAGAVNELALHGVTPDREPRLEPWGLREAWISDPDGLRIVLVEIPADHPLRTDVRAN